MKEAILMADPRIELYDSRFVQLSKLSDEQVLQRFNFSSYIVAEYYRIGSANLGSRRYTRDQIIQRGQLFARGAVCADEMFQTARLVGDYKLHDEKQNDLSIKLKSSKAPYISENYGTDLPVTDPETYFSFMADTLVNWQAIGVNFPYEVEVLERLAPIEDVDTLFYKYGVISYLASKAQIPVKNSI